jgi:hypothetical protein
MMNGRKDLPNPSCPVGRRFLSGRGLIVRVILRLRVESLALKGVGYKCEVNIVILCLTALRSHGAGRLGF